jgi:hypothetical protein
MLCKRLNQQEGIDNHYHVDLRRKYICKLEAEESIITDDFVAGDVWNF